MARFHLRPKAIGCILGDDLALEMWESLPCYPPECTTGQKAILVSDVQITDTNYRYNSLSTVSNGVVDLILTMAPLIVLIFFFFVFSHCLLHRQCYSYLHETTKIQKKKKRIPSALTCQQISFCIFICLPVLAYICGTLIAKLSPLLLFLYPHSFSVALQLFLCMI